MSVGVISGTAKNGQRIEVVFEAYYQPDVTTSSSNSFNNWLTQRHSVASNLNSSSSKDKFKVLTFDNLQREADGRWATHEITGQDRKPLLEFLGPGLTSLSFSVFLSATLGVNPTSEIKKFQQLRDQGIVCNLIIGGSVLSENKWALTKLSESLKTFDGSGNLMIAALNITLLEYVETEG